MLKSLFNWLFPAALALPQGRTPDPSSNFGFDAAIQLLASQVLRPVTFNTAATLANTLTAANMVSAGIILRTGTPAGAVTDTTDTATKIISTMGGGNPQIVPIDGTYGEVMRLSNTTGQTITLAGGTGVTVSGTATVANNTWRDFIMTPTSASTLAMTNIGSGTV